MIQILQSNRCAFFDRELDASDDVGFYGVSNNLKAVISNYFDGFWINFWGVNIDSEMITSDYDKYYDWWMISSMTEVIFKQFHAIYNNSSAISTNCLYNISWTLLKSHRNLKQKKKIVKMQKKKLILIRSKVKYFFYYSENYVYSNNLLKSDVTEKWKLISNSMEKIKILSVTWVYSEFCKICCAVYAAQVK